MPDNGLVPIGELARRTGVATSALRYYERIGLLPPAERASQRNVLPVLSVTDLLVRIGRVRGCLGQRDALVAVDRAVDESYRGIPMRARPARWGQAQVELERQGTFVHLMSDNLTRDQLLTIAAGLRPAPITSSI